MCRFGAKVVLIPSLFLAELCFGAGDGAKQLTVPAGTLLRVEVTRRTRLHKDRPIEGRLLEPVYAENRLLIPSGATLEGTISELRPATHGKRLEAKFHGDFTPLNEPVIQWTELERSDGSRYPLLGESADGAGSTLYFRSAGAAHPSLFRQAWTTMVGRKDSAVNSVTAPHKWDRLQRFFWSQMPYRPQYLEEGSQYEMALTEDLQVSAEPRIAPVSLNRPQALEGTVSVHSRLRTDLSSTAAKAGDPVEAIVTQPVLDGQNQVILPQNSILHGKVLSATRSRRWGRNGMLRFSFDEVSFPSGFRQNVEATPMAIESSADTRLAIDEEGGVSPQTNHSIAAPLVMGLLSASALGDDDGGLGKAAVSSNGFAIVGRLLAIATGSRYVGGSIGAIATGRTIYSRWLAHGKDTHFGHDTEVILEMSPAHARRMTPVQ
jgi:hypothetical protein